MKKLNSLMSKTFVAAIATAILGTACSSLTTVQTPAMQHAIVEAGTGDIDVLSLQQIPVLTPETGEVLVRVYAAAINPRDWKFRAGMYADRAPGTGYGEPKVTPASPENTLVPGTDAAGIIEKLGPGVSQYQVGDAVFASVKGKFIASRLNGAYSEFVVVSAENLIRKPADMTFAQASGLGNATMTGVGTVVGMNVKAGDRILILGASGGVGSSAVQAAVARGAYVIGTASPRHNDFLNSLGIDEIHNYREGTWQDDIRNIDYVIDTVSKDNLMLALKTVKPGATIVGFNGSLSEQECVEYKVKCFGRGIGGAEALAAVSELADAGLLHINVDATFPLAEAGAAQEENRNGGTQGKIVLIVDKEHANSK
jgi:NADPH:quinone reductase-like Zn-dependent oxidoreductase